MARIPTVYQQAQQPQNQTLNIDSSGFQDNSGAQQATKSVQSALSQYQLDQKKTFDLARITEAKNELDVNEAKLASDQNDGWQSKQGQNAILFRDNDGNDFTSHYQSRFNTIVGDIKQRLQLTPEQAKTFDEYAQQRGTNLNQQLQSYQLQQGQAYKKSVFQAAVDVEQRKAIGGFGDLENMDQSLQNMNSQIENYGRSTGQSNAEILNNIANSNAKVHAENMKLLHDQENYKAGQEYIKRYGRNMTELEKQTYIQRFNDLGESQVTQLAINNMRYGMSNGSKTAFNTPDPIALLNSAQIPQTDFANLKYNDPRLDSQLVHLAKQKSMDWAIPLLTGIRVAGERSNNNAVSPANAKGVYQLTPIAIQQVKNLTGRDIDPTNPEEATFAALTLVDWISKKYNTQDPKVIAAYYNGGGNRVKELMSGGVDAIKNTENKNYVNRVSSFDFNSYANKPSSDAIPDVSNLSPKNQAKVYAAREEMLRQQKQQKKDASNQLYEQASDMITQRQITSVEQLNNSPEIVKALDSDQLKGLQNQIDASNGRYSTDEQNAVLQNPSKLKGMPQSQFNVWLKAIPPNMQGHFSNLYAQWNGRTLQDANAAQRQAQSNIDISDIYSTIRQNSGSLGFVGAATGKAVVQNKNSNSAFYVAMTNDLVERVKNLDDAYFNQTGKRYSKLQIQAITRSFMGSSTGTTQSAIRTYDPNVNRSDVPDDTKAVMLRLAQRNPIDRRFTSVDKMDESTFFKYYFQVYRGNQ